MKYLLLISVSIGILGAIFYQKQKLSQIPDINLVYLEYKQEYTLSQRKLEQEEKQQSFNNLSLWEKFKYRVKDLAKIYQIHPSVPIAQASIESGNGSSLLAKNYNNFLGLGAYDRNHAMRFSTMEEGIIYYFDLISKNRLYKKAYQKRSDPYQMIKEIKQAGYAADPYYINKVINSYEFQNNL